MAADGFSRTSDRKKFGIVAVQSQAGAENALGGVAQAYADNIPILILPGGVSLSELAVQPNYSVSQNYRGVVKRVEAIYRPDQVVAVMRRAPPLPSSAARAQQARRSRAVKLQEREGNGAAAAAVAAGWPVTPTKW